MLALVEITPWHWVGFIAAVVIFLALDLGVFHRTARLPSFKAALGWSQFWLALSFFFAALLIGWRGRETAVEYLTAYCVELSLSLDNIFVIALIFAHFKVRGEYQHRVLFWGILGALIMRGIMILAGIQLIKHFDWVLYIFALFLLVTGAKMLFPKAEENPEQGLVFRLARRLFTFAPDYDGQKFVTRWKGRRVLTPLFLVLLMVEGADLLFALDSIPAVFGVTRQPFIVFTSNVFAILGLRSLFFVLARAMGYFRHLKFGLALILVFISVKMLMDPHDHPPLWFQMALPSSVTLGGIVVILSLSIFASLVTKRGTGGRS